MKKRQGIAIFFALAAWLGATEALATNAPSNLVATALSSSQIQLTWTDNSTDEIGFTFMMDTNAAFTNPTFVWTGGANVTSYTQSGLSPATTYYFQIKAEGNPDSAWTSTASATTAPANLAVTPTSNSAMNLTWTGNGGNANVIGYTYAYATNSSFTNATYVWVTGNTASSASRTGLSTSATYWVKIKAEGVTDALDSPFSPAVTTTTTPASLTATPVSSSQINLIWSGNSGNANITGYTVATATNSSFTSATYQFVSGASSTSFSSTGLYAGTTYFYKIKAEGTSDAYDSPFTAAVSAATSGAAPNAPSGLSATVVSSSQINLSWTDNSSNETAFEVKRATDSGFTQNVVWIGGIQGSTYSDTALSASTTYYYKVRAKGVTQDSAYSNVVSATTSASGDTIPAAPSGLTATATSSTRIDLSWTDNSSNETGFEVKRATDSGFTQNVVWIGGIQGASYGDTGLTPSTTYYYEVRAEGTAGKSAYSNAASATTSSSTVQGGTPISPHFFGINAWMPQQIGGVTFNGKLASVWPAVQTSHAAISRYGGHAVDEDADPAWIDVGPPPSDLCQTGDDRQTTLKQYANLVGSMRYYGLEPVLQVPYYGGKYTASQAADVVRCVNVTLALGVKYWSIGNEPDLDYAAHASSDVASYMRSFASAMKAVDPTIKIVGPETAWYDTTILNDLTCGAQDIIGTDVNGNTYLDVLSFHAYPYPTKDANGNKVWPTRSDVIGKLMSSNGFDANLAQLRTRVDSCNGTHLRSGTNALQIAVTEANINYENPSNDSIDGVGAQSFLGGQFWSEMLGVAMLHGVDFVTFWSTVEGDSVSNDKGYIGRDGTTKRPSYYHFQMMAENFRGNAVTVTDDQANVKTFAAIDADQIAVMILNEDAAAMFTYTVRLDGNAVSTSSTLKVNVPAGLQIESSGTIPYQASIVLIFDASGTLKKKIEYDRYGSGTPVETLY